ncbi:hypothetical protein [Catellatospora sp. NPDC049609]|uniref:hypothetical protein n=1 Tax=Catellatospora sp. NPDC049609 TaxID=3155505 RepID=UPI0034326800
MDDDAERVAASLTQWLGTVTFENRAADQVTDLLVEAVLAWGAAQGWRVYRRAKSVVPLPPPYADRHSWVDVGIARPGLAPIVVEVDQSDRKRTLEKLTAEAGQGRVALWLRWGPGPFHAPPAPVRLVSYQVAARKDASGKRLFTTATAERPAPVHSGVELSSADQGDLFGFDPPDLA